MPPKDQIFIGAATAFLCLLALFKGDWILNNTAKGERLANWLGADRAVWVLRILLGAGIVFGILLAMDVIRPLQW